MGVIDEYQILKEDEMYCVISEDDVTFEEVEGPIVVVKNPCLHPGLYLFCFYRIPQKI